MLYATAGRLTPLSSRVTISVTETVKGTAAVLMYDGTGVPEVRTTTVKGLIADTTYSFKVAPINALGEGILSKSSIPVVARSGASPVYTTANGSSLTQGITNDVDEEQVITTVGCTAPIRIAFGSSPSNFTNSMTEDAFKYLLEYDLSTGAVD
eukprot:gene6327-7580_t